MKQRMLQAMRTAAAALAVFAILGVGLVAASALLLTPQTAYADLQNYAPLNVSVTVASGELLAVQTKALDVVQLTNTGSYDVWFCHLSQTAVVGKGFYLPSGGSIVLSGFNCPEAGLTGIADGGTTTVAIARG